jgi:hypothetical protein
MHVGGTDAVGDNNLKVDGTLAQVGVATFTANIVANGNIVGDGSTVITNIATWSGNLVPTTDGLYDLGTSSSEWQDAYIDGTLHVDAITNGADIALNRALVSLTVTGDMTANGNIVGDGSTVVTNLGALALGSVRWDDGSSKIDGEQIADNTIDSDAMDPTQTAFTTITNAALNIYGATLTLSGNGTFNGNILGDDSTVISNIATIACDTLSPDGTALAIDTGTGEVTVDSKYAVVGPDATTARMADGGQFTLNGSGVYTQAYTAAYTSGQHPVLTYAEDPGTNANPYVTTDDGTNFVANGAASKKVNWAVVGTRP